LSPIIAQKHFVGLQFLRIFKVLRCVQLMLLYVVCDARRVQIINKYILTHSRRKLRVDSLVILNKRKIISCWKLRKRFKKTKIIKFNNSSFSLIVRVSLISHVHTFGDIPALLLMNTLRFLIRAGIFTKV
jgi:hypothetical protein